MEKWEEMYVGVRETFEAESNAVVVAVEIVSVAVAAVEVERETVAVFRVKVPARHHVVAGLTRSARRHRLVAVAGPVAPSSIAAPTSVRRGHRMTARRVAIVLSSKVVLIAAAAAVHQRSTLSHLCIPVEPQVLVEAGTRLFRQEAGICQHTTRVSK